MQLTTNPSLVCHKVDTPNKIGFYEQDFYVFSNFSSFQIQYCDKIFPTSEHLYHWFKFMNSAPGVADMIIKARSAHEAFKLSRQYKDSVTGNWEDKVYVLKVMLNILINKISQHEYVYKKLLDSYDNGRPRKLVEDSYRDDFWGEGEDGTGKNWLGVLWMILRAEVKSFIDKNGDTYNHTVYEEHLRFCTQVFSQNSNHIYKTVEVLYNNGGVPINVSIMSVCGYLLWQDIYTPENKCMEINLPMQISDQKKWEKASTDIVGIINGLSEQDRCESNKVKLDLNDPNFDITPKKTESVGMEETMDAPKREDTGVTIETAAQSNSILPIGMIEKDSVVSEVSLEAMDNFSDELYEVITKMKRCKDLYTSLCGSDNDTVSTLNVCIDSLKLKHRNIIQTLIKSE